MKNSLKLILFYFSLFSLLYSSCFIPSKRKNKEQVVEIIPDYDSMYNNYIKSCIKDTVNYLKINISTDSLDYELFSVTSMFRSYSKPELYKKIETLINKGANPNAVIEMTTVTQRIGTYIPGIKKLYKSKYRKHTEYSSSFQAAVGSGNTPLVKKLLDNGADINMPGKSRIRAIDIAAAGKDIKMIDFLIKNNCNPKYIDLREIEDVDLIETLVKKGANPKTININFALWDHDDLKRLLKLKPNLSHFYIEFNNAFKPGTIDILLNAGLDPNIRGEFYHCPLIFGAIEYSDLETIKKLEKAGAKLTAICKLRTISSPIKFAESEGKFEIYQYLLEKTQQLIKNNAK